MGLSGGLRADHSGGMILSKFISMPLARLVQPMVCRFIVSSTIAFVHVVGGAQAEQLPAFTSVAPLPAKSVETLPKVPAGDQAQTNEMPETDTDAAFLDKDASVSILDGRVYDIRPPARAGHLPKTRWQHMEGHSIWTRAALSALKAHGSPLVDMVPGDIANWCPAYADNDDEQRRAFWVGYMSALAKHESTYKPWAVGGGGRWYGLLQILPATARGYKCNVGTGEALKNGAANLSCGVRIMAYTVKRDGVIHGRDSKWRGVSADWGPMRNTAKRRDMASWLKQQSYCSLANSVRPRLRP